MKVVFRTYTKKDGAPDYGYWAVLQHLEGLKDKDILVRIDIDKKNQLGYDEVDVFCPSLKISHLELRQIEDSKFEATFDTKNLRAVFQVLLYMGKAGNGGHSYELLIGDKSFYIDGDGNDYLESINGTPLHKIKEDNRYDWSDIYNKDIEKNTQDMKNNSIKLNETQMRGTVEKAVRQMLQEFQAGGNDWGQTYSEYKNRGFQTNRELDEVVQELHTICQYAEDLYNAAYKNQPSKYFQGCTQPYLKLAYEFVDPIYGLLANRTNLKNDAQAMTLEEIKEECMESLKHLSEMSRLGRVRDAAKRAYDLLNAEPATAVNEAQLRKVVAESVKKVLKEGSFEEDIFDVYTNAQYQDAPCYVNYQSVLYQIPEQFQDMLSELNDIDGRRTFLAAIESGKFPTSSVSILTLKGLGYEGRSFNANAY